MNKNTRLIVIVVFLWALAAVAFGQANQWGPYDPGAARSDLNNVAPSTGRAALELGTMAVATATDYVATDTFTGHTDAVGTAVHGLGTISTKADTDYVATSALALRLDTVNASFTGDIDVTGDVGAATINGVAPLTAAEKTQALVGDAAIDHVGAIATYSKIIANGDGGVSHFSVGGGNVWTIIERQLTLNLAAGATQRIATFTLDAYSGAYIELTGGGIQQGVGSFGVRKTWKIHRDNAGCTVAVDVNTQWGTVGTMGDQLVITAGSTAGEVGLTFADPGAAGVVIYGSLKISGKMTKYPTW